MPLHEPTQPPADTTASARSATPALRKRFVALSRQLTLRIAQEAAHSEPSQPLRAFLLFEQWRDNPLAAEYDRYASAHAPQRQSVPEPFYKGREGDAPCLVSLPPEIWPPTESGRLEETFAEDWWAAWLERIWIQAHQRLARQDFAAVLLTRSHMSELASHLVLLGRQTPPDGSAVRLFRYQDPRVIERMWPALTPAQRKCWLGPILAWYAPQHPWGPWSPELIGEDALPEEPLPQWFKAQSPTPEQIEPNAHIRLGALFDAQQWALAHCAPIGNQIWCRCAMEGFDITEQPDGKTVDRLIAEGQALGLSDDNLEDFIWYGWLGRWTDPKTGRLRSAWQLPQNAQGLRRALDALAQAPQSRLSVLLSEAGALP